MPRQPHLIMAIALATALAGAVLVLGGLFAYGHAGHPLALFAAMVLVVVFAVPRWRTRHRWWS